MAKKNPEFNFETALAELNSLVEKMEKGGMSLEDSLRDFERGVSLTRQCQNALKVAEQKVQILSQTGGLVRLDPYEAEPKDF